MTERLLVGLLAGAAWNALSLYCLSRLLRAWLAPSLSPRRAAAWFLVKFPLLYAAAWFCLSRPAVSLIGFSLGFTAVLLIVLAWAILRVQRMTVARSHGR